MWVLFEWRTGNVIRHLEPSGDEGSDKIVLAADGMDSAVLNVPMESLPLSVRNSWQTSFVGIKHGLAYYENSSSGPVVVYAGQLKTRSIVDGSLRLQATSMMDYLEHYIYAHPTTSVITDPDQLYEFNNVTAKQYASILVGVVSSDSAAPSIAVGVGAGPSTTFTTSRRARELPTVGSMLQELMEDPAGSEFRFTPSIDSSLSKISWAIDFPSEGRLFPGRHGSLSYNLSDANVSLITLSPNSTYDDYFNTLWHEVPVEPPEGAEDWDPVIDLRKSENIPAGFPRYSRSLSLGEMSESERNALVSSRINDSSRALENWEINVWDESVIGGELSHPLTWVDSSSGALGRRVNITGGAEYEAEGLNGSYRCVGVEFSSNSSSVRIQLSDERAVYSRMPRTIIEKMEKERDRDRFPYTTINAWRRPDGVPGGYPGGGGGAQLPPGVGDLTNPNWEWGSENTPFPEMPPFGNSIYGLEFGEHKRSSSGWIKGNGLPKQEAASDLSTRWIWAQDNLGNGVYNTFFENYNAIQTKPYGSGAGADAYNGIGFTVRTQKVPNENKHIIPVVGDPVVAGVSSGRLEAGELVDFARRINIRFDNEFMNKLVFSGKAFQTNGYFEQPKALHFYLYGIKVYEERILLFVKINVLNHEFGTPSWARDSGAELNRIIVLRKGDTFDSIDPNITMISASKRWQIGSSFLVNSFAGNIRASDQVLDYLANPQLLENSVDPEDEEASIDGYPDWKLVSASFNNNGYSVESGFMSFPAVQIDGSWTALDNIFGITGFNKMYPNSASSRSLMASSSWGTVAKGSITGMDLYSVGEGSASGVLRGFTSMSIPLKNFGFQNIVNGVYTPLCKFKDGTSTLASHDANVFNGENLTLFVQGVTTIMGCPLVHGLMLDKTTNKMGVFFAYSRRMYVSKGSLDAGDFDPHVYGGFFPSTGSKDGLNQNHVRYGNNSLVPQLSITAKNVHDEENNVNNWMHSGGLASASIAVAPSLFYFDGWVYLLPSNYGSLPYGSSDSIPSLLAIRVKAVEDPYDFPGGSEPINSPTFGLTE